ncbi:hypothetical protein EIN_236100, partial [Entamoeba invadens IP1]
NGGEIFNSNTDPIVIVLPRNGGGFVDAEDFLYKIISPSTNYEKANVARISESSEKVLRNGFGALIEDPVTHIRRVPRSNSYYDGDLGDFYNKPGSEFYGENKEVEFKHIQKSHLIENTRDFPTMNARKKNQIVVFSDHFCFSACSLFTYHFSEKKSAITATYCGLPDSTFRNLGESPTAVIQDDYIHDGLETVVKDMGFKMGISYLPTLPLNESDLVPNEYKVHQPMEHTNIQFYYGDEQSVDEFLEVAEAYIEKYKNWCETGELKEDIKCSENNASEVWGRLCENEYFNMDKCIFVRCADKYFYNNKTKACQIIECEEGQNITYNSKCTQNSDSEMWGSPCINNVLDSNNCSFMECKTGYLRDEIKNMCYKKECEDSTQIVENIKCPQASISELWGIKCINGRYNTENCEFMSCKSGYMYDDIKKTCVVQSSSCKDGEIRIDQMCKETSEKEFWAAKCVNGKYDNTNCVFYDCTPGYELNSDKECVKKTVCNEGAILPTKLCKDAKDGEIWAAKCINGSFNYTNCEFAQCDDGYTLSDDTNKRCVKNGENTDSATILCVVTLTLLMVILV